MGRNTLILMSLILAVGVLVLTNGCSIFVSAPHTAKINIQDLNNMHHEYIVVLDAPAGESKLDFQITSHYAVQLDFDWLWNTENDFQLTDGTIPNDDTIPALIPWMMCTYRF